MKVLFVALLSFLLSSCAHPQPWRSADYLTIPPETIGDIFIFSIIPAWEEMRVVRFESPPGLDPVMIRTEYRPSARPQTKQLSVEESKRLRSALLSLDWKGLKRTSGFVMDGTDVLFKSRIGTAHYEEIVEVEDEDPAAKKLLIEIGVFIE